jgi:hypothetical protein
MYVGKQKTCKNNGVHEVTFDSKPIYIYRERERIYEIHRLEYDFQILRI